MTAGRLSTPIKVAESEQSSIFTDCRINLAPTVGKLEGTGNGKRRPDSGHHQNAEGVAGH